METSSAKDTLARSLDAWRLADQAFEEAESERARAEVMLRQLRAREIAERTCWAEKQIPFSLRARALEYGLWSAEEAIDRLRRMDFVSRHAFVLHHLGVFPDDALGAVLALARRPQPGDGAAWFADEAAVAAIAARLARAGQHDAALDAIRALGARRAEALRSCAPYLPGAAAARAVSEIEAWIPEAEPIVRFLSWCDLLPLLPARDRERARGEIVRLRAAFEAEEAEGRGPGGFSARTRAAHAFAGAGMLEASEAECQGLDDVEELLSVARELPGEPRVRIARLALERARTSRYLPAALADVVAVCPALADEAIACARDEADPAAGADALLRLAAHLGEPRASALFHEAFGRIEPLGDVAWEALEWIADWAAEHGPSLTEGERAALGERAGRGGAEAEGRGSTPPVEAAASRLGRLLFGPKRAAAILTDRGFDRVLDFAEHHATGDDLALVIELARGLQGERRARLARALLQSGEELYDSPGFAGLFSPEEQREHLRAALARHEGPACVEILATLEHAARLAVGAPRGVLLALYLDEVRERGGRVRLRGLFTAASLAEGDQRAALVDEVLALVETCDELDEADRAEAIAAVMPLLPAARAVPLAGRVLDAVADGQIGRTWAGDRLMAIPDPVWAALPASRWEPALRWALEEGEEFFAWTSWQQKTLPREVRAMLEAQGSAAPPPDVRDEAASPSPATMGAGEGELSPEERLRRWASGAASRSEAEREASAPEIEAAVRAVLAKPDTEDGVLCDVLASLPDAALSAIWSARARADVWRRTTDISDPALFAYLPSEHYLHAEAVLRLVLRLGGPSALCDLARMLVQLQKQSAA
ncbi:hypothetical protein SOCE26_067360 [Sorangium cellulosum]|uniref:Uncharacterized protein n=1 Tax=Sorangium cellulosum TaxID=56 RepID=A0A2L0F120_SORCE|nr:hypothetical protein [Sorangium cellulosum]AUX45255.1 hypothetical protein SOCE26_067360 [Sorangium cellulosum]